MMEEIVDLILVATGASGSSGGFADGVEVDALVGREVAGEVGETFGIVGDGEGTRKGGGVSLLLVDTNAGGGLHLRC